MAYPLLESNIGRQIMINHSIVSDDSPLSLQIQIPSDDEKFYEVIRCIDGVPLFLEDHLQRLEISVLNKIDLDIEILKKDIISYLKHIGMVNGNIKIVITAKTQIIHESIFYYPSSTEYSNGVNTGILKWERTDPNIKAVRDDYKIAIANKLKTDGPHGKYFETLLYGNDSMITEGSRSNVFFVKGNEILTAPDDEILMGITRKYILTAIESAGGKLVKNKISASIFTNSSDKTSVDAAFLSGTSIGVLPISSIENTVLNSSQNLLVNKISEQYNNIVINYIESRK